MNNIEKVLSVLFEDSYREYHIRLLAKLTKLNPNTIISIVSKLKHLLIIHKDEQTNRVIIKANTQNDEFKLRKKFYNIQKLVNSKIIDFLNEAYSIPTIILFGSYAKAENHKESDIDLFIICDEKKDVNLNSFEKKLQAQIQLFVHTKQSFGKLRKSNKELLNNVLNGYILSGFVNYE